MNETLKGTENHLTNQVAMDFYNAIKEIGSLYPYLRVIQDKIDERRRRFRCNIVVNKSLPSDIASAARIEISRIIQQYILPHLPGFQSNVDDIVFVVKPDSSGEGLDKLPCIVRIKRFFDPLLKEI